jgi:hypothetical protein
MPSERVAGSDATNMIDSGCVDNLANQQSIIRVSAMVAAP